MIPQIINLGPIPINSFGLCVALAILAGIYRLQMSFKLNGINPGLAEKYVFTAGIVGLLGARILFLIDHYSEIKDYFFEAVFASAGFVFFGGFILSTIVLILMSRYDKIPLAKFLDSLGPTLAIGYLIGRLGCQLAGDGDYGIVTESIFGMSYKTGVIATAPGVLAFPTPFYESTMFVVILYFLTLIETKANWQKPYKRFAMYLILISIERFLIEFLRINPKLLQGLSEAQLISIVILFIGAFLIWFSGRNKSSVT